MLRRDARCLAHNDAALSGRRPSVETGCWAGQATMRLAPQRASVLRADVSEA